VVIGLAGSLSLRFGGFCGGLRQSKAWSVPTDFQAADGGRRYFIGIIKNVSDKIFGL
jgi:hypothetical protein